MLYRFSRLHWYDLILFSMAALVAYPDKVAAWIGELLGKEFNWLHAILIAAVGICGSAAAMIWLMPMYPELKWMNLGLIVGALTIFRSLIALVVGMFGFDD